MDLTFLILAIFLSIIVYWYLKSIQNHWDNQNVPSIPNPNLFFGHMLPIITMKENVIEFVDRAYKSFHSSMVGFYFLRRPGIIVRDPDLVKSILQTNFSSFRNNIITVSEKNDPIVARNPFFMKDLDHWKVYRNRVTNYMSDKKLKHIGVIIHGVCDKMTEFVRRKIQENDEFYECDLNKHFTRYTGEIVANAVFAMEGQSFEDNPDHLSYAEVGKTLLEPTFINAVKQTFMFYLPGVAHFFGFAWITKKTVECTRRIIKANLEKRQQMGLNEAPKDYLQLIVESNSDLDGILADVINFHIELYDSSSTVIASLFYMLSLNPEIQVKLRDHIATMLKNSNGRVTYDCLKTMTYLDQAIQETMRIYPTLGLQMKYCTEEITLKGSDGLICHLKPGNPVFIPVLGLQHDEKYWPNPDVFDPDRFSLENQANNNRYTYLSFGEGPRMCPGIRLALMIAKYATVSLITQFSIEYSPKTKLPLKIKPNSLLLWFKGGLWARFIKL